MLELNRPLPRFVFSDWKLLALQRQSTFSMQAPQQGSDSQRSSMYELTVHLLGDASDESRYTRLWRFCIKYAPLLQASATLVGMIAVLFSSRGRSALLHPIPSNAH